MATLTLIRHAPTRFNQLGKFMGKLNARISNEGAILAKNLNGLIGEEAFTKHYCSPLKRAMETANIVFPSSEIILDEKLQERDLGSWAGKSINSVMKKFPNAFLLNGQMDPFYTPPKGEPLDMFFNRVSSFLCDLLTFESEEHIAIVSHNGVLRILRCIVEQKTVRDIFKEWEPQLTPRTFDLTGVQSEQIKNYSDKLKHNIANNL